MWMWFIAKNLIAKHSWWNASEQNKGGKWEISYDGFMGEEIKFIKSKFKDNWKSSEERRWF